jgi:hypothetical protein
MSHDSPGGPPPEMPASRFPARLLGDNDCLVQAEVFDTGVAQLDALPGEPGYRKVAAFGHDRLHRKP